MADVEHTVDTPETETVASRRINRDGGRSFAFGYRSGSYVPFEFRFGGGNYGVEPGAENDRHSLVNFFRGNFDGDHLTPVRSLR